MASVNMSNVNFYNPHCVLEPPHKKPAFSTLNKDRLPIQPIISQSLALQYDRNNDLFDDSLPSLGELLCPSRNEITPQIPPQNYNFLHCSKQELLGNSQQELVIIEDDSDNVSGDEEQNASECGRATQDTATTTCSLSSPSTPRDSGYPSAHFSSKDGQQFLSLTELDSTIPGQAQRLSPDCPELAGATDHDKMRPSNYNTLRQVLDKSPPPTCPTTLNRVYVRRNSKGEPIIIEDDSDNDGDYEAEGGVVSSDLIASSEDQCASNKSIVEETRIYNGTPLRERAGGSCDCGCICDTENELRQTPEGTEGLLHPGAARSQCEMMNGDDNENGIEGISGKIEVPISNCQQLNGGLQHQQEEDGSTIVTSLSQDRQQSVRLYHRDSEHDQDEDDKDMRPRRQRKRRYVDPTIDQAHTRITQSSPADTELAQSADYQEYSFEGICKRVRIGQETTYNLQFSIKDLPNLFKPSINLQMSNSTFSGESVEGSGYPQLCASHAKKSKLRPAVQKQRKRQPLRGRVESDLVEIDVMEEIYQVEALLAKSTVRNVVWYLVKWEGFGDDKNTWQEWDDISSDLIDDFEASYQGNFAGVELLKKRERRGKIEYFVKWKGRPASENSWEKENTISRERIMEFEAR